MKLLRSICRAAPQAPPLLFQLYPSAKPLLLAMSKEVFLIGINIE